MPLPCPDGRRDDLRPPGESHCDEYARRASFADSLLESAANSFRGDFTLTGQPSSKAVASATACANRRPDRSPGAFRKKTAAAEPVAPGFHCLEYPLGAGGDGIREAGTRVRQEMDSGAQPRHAPGPRRNLHSTNEPGRLSPAWFMRWLLLVSEDGVRDDRSHGRSRRRHSQIEGSGNWHSTYCGWGGPDDLDKMVRSTVCVRVCYGSWLYRSGCC